MGKKLYIGGLPYQVTEDELGDVFRDIGEVTSIKIITDQYSGQSKGFGFVEMATDEDAQSAIEKLNETDLKGRKIIVNEARPPRDRGGRDGGGGYRGGNNRGGGGNNRRW